MKNTLKRIGIIVIVLVVFISIAAGVYLHSNKWIPRGWTSITSSSDGTKLAAVEYGGQIYTSTDSGVTWR